MTMLGAMTATDSLINITISYCINQAGLGAFTAKSGRKHYNPPPLTVMWMNFDSPNFPSLCSLSAIISFQTCSNKCILYLLLFHKCIKIKYKTVNMYGVFLWLVQSSSRWNTIHSHRNYCWVFGSANSVTRPDHDNQYNMRIVYTDRHVNELRLFQIFLDCVCYQQYFHFKLVAINNSYVCLNFMHASWSNIEQ